MMFPQNSIGRVPRLIISLALVALLFVACQANAEIDVAHSALDAEAAERGLAFANHLMGDGDYFRAIGEFKRFLYLHPDDSRVGLARLSIGKCLFLAGRNDDVIDWHHEIVQAAGAPCPECDLLAGHSHFRLGKYDIAIRVLANLSSDRQDPLRAAQASYLSGLSAVRLQQYDMAVPLFERIGEDSPYRTKAKTYLAILNSGNTYSVKNATTAGLLALFPGLGYAYSEHYQTALASLVVNGLLIWATADAFGDRDRAEGITVSIFATGFYLGNIVGSVQSAHRYNNYEFERFHGQFVE